MVLQFCSIFEKPVPTDTVLDAWHAVLADIEIEYITEAAMETLKVSKWMPRPAEIREAAALLWRRDLEAKERQERVRLTYKGPGEPMTREQLHEAMVELGMRVGTWEEFESRERERDANKRRAAARSI